MTKFKRRKFGQLVVASLTATSLVGVASKGSAQQSEILIGVSQGKADPQNPEDETTSVGLTIAEPTTGKVLSQADISPKQVSNPSPTLKANRAFYVGDQHRVSDITVQKNGTVVVATVSHTRTGCFNKLLLTNSRSPQKSRAVKVLNLKSPDHTIESLLSLSDKQIICTIGHNGIPPFQLAIIDPQTGKVRSGKELSLPTLPERVRFANLCQTPDGYIYATQIDSDGIPILVRMDLEEKAGVTGQVKIQQIAQLTFRGQLLSNDLKSLTSSSSGQLYAIATIDNGDSNTLFSVDAQTGKMTRVADEFAAEKIVISG
jgi:hypothetical protein